MDFHNNPTMQNKLTAVNTLMRLKQERSENTLAFTIKVEKALQHAKSLNITFDEIAVGIYMKTVVRAYNSSVRTIH